MGKIENVRIKSTSITMADHGCLTFWLNVEGNCWGCGIGGYMNGVGHLGATEWKGNGTAIVAMMKIMDTVGVEKWEDLEGQYMRIESEGWGSTIHKIGNLIEDKWFDLKEFFSTDKGEFVYEYKESLKKERKEME